MHTFPSPREAAPSDTEQPLAEILGQLNIHVNFIFNKHKDSEDAQNTAEHIPDSSVVFIEGFNTKPNSSTSATLRELAARRYLLGDNSPEYRALYDDLLRVLHSEAYCPARDYTDFQQCQSVLLALLLDKGCDVLIADYDIKRHGDSLDEKQRLLIEKTLTSAGLGNTPLSSAKFASALRRQLIDTHRVHHVREVAAVREVIIDLTRLQAFDKKSPTHHLDNTTPIYMVYGSAHHHSLPSAFSEFGVTSHSIVNLSKLSPVENLPAHNEIPRRASARLALHALIEAGMSSPAQRYSELLQNTHSGTLATDETLLTLINICSAIRNLCVKPGDLSADEEVELDRLLFTLENSYANRLE